MLATHLPVDSPLALATSDGDSMWELVPHLLAAILDETRQGNWQRGGGKGQRPKPVERPGVNPGKKTEQIGGGSTYSVGEMKELLAQHSGR